MDNHSVSRETLLDSGLGIFFQEISFVNSNTGNKLGTSRANVAKATVTCSVFRSPAGKPDSRQGKFTKKSQVYFVVLTMRKRN
jgi:hypothetical protein